MLICINYPDFHFSVRTPGQVPEDLPFAGGGRYLPHTSSSSGLALVGTGLGTGHVTQGGPVAPGDRRRRSTDSRESVASHGSQVGLAGTTASSTLRHSHSSGHKTLSRRGSRHRCSEDTRDTRGTNSRPRSPLPVSPATPLYSKKELGLSEPGKTPTQDASDRY